MKYASFENKKEIAVILFRIVGLIVLKSENSQ